MKKLKKALLKFCLIFVLLNAGLFVIFFFDLDGKLLFNVVEPSSRSTTTTWSARTSSRSLMTSTNSPSTNTTDPIKK